MAENQHTKILRYAAALKRSELNEQDKMLVLAIAANMAIHKDDRCTDLELMDKLGITHWKYYTLKAKRETKDLMETIVYETAIKAMPDIVHSQIKRAEQGDKDAVKFIHQIVTDYKNKENQKRGGAAQEVAAIEAEFINFVSDKFGSGTVERMKLTKTTNAV